MKKILLIVFVALLGIPAFAQNNRKENNIEAHNLGGKVLNVFATSGGSGVDGSAGDLKKAYPQYKWSESRLMN